MSTEILAPLADLPDAVQWSEGMLLSPQHLQQGDIYWHSLARCRMASLEPDYWGLLSLSLDPKAWDDGVLKLTQVSAILPDGLPVSFPLDNEERILSLNLKTEKLLSTDGRPLRIWLGMPHRSGDSARQDGYLQRYASLTGAPAVDENTGANPMPLARLRPTLVLLCDPASLSRYAAFPLLEVRCDAEGRIRMGSYQPPMLRIGAGDFLGEDGLSRQLPALGRRVWAKLREVEALIDEDNPGQRHLAIARQLAVALPQYDIVAGAPDTHPREAYRALALLVGQAAGLGAPPLPPQLTPYRHQECGNQFQVALTYVNRRLAAIDTNMEKLPFTNMGETGFVRRLAVDGRADKLVIELKPRAGQELRDLAQWLEGARIASDDLMTVLRQRRLSGARVRSLNHAERRQLGLKEGALMFMVINQDIEVDGQTLNMFRAGRPLLIRGAADNSMPSGILLYRWKNEQTLPGDQVELPPEEEALLRLEQDGLPRPGELEPVHA